MSDIFPFPRKKAAEHITPQRVEIVIDGVEAMLNEYEVTVLPASSYALKQRMWNIDPNAPESTAAARLNGHLLAMKNIVKDGGNRVILIDEIRAYVINHPELFEWLAIARKMRDDKAIINGVPIRLEDVVTRIESAFECCHIDPESLDSYIGPEIAQLEKKELTQELMMHLGEVEKMISDTFDRTVNKKLVRAYIRRNPSLVSLYARGKILSPNKEL